jgi:hypothetical protein
VFCLGFFFAANAAILLRRLTIDVSVDDLRTLAERGYEGAASDDQDQQAQALGPFRNDTPFCKSDRVNSSRAVMGDGVTSRGGVR